MTQPLPLARGRAPRVALLVYNDAHADSRVIKTAASLRDAGAQVRIFAVARSRSGYPEGPDTVGGDDAIPVLRSREFDLAREAPWVLSAARAILGITPPAGDEPAVADPSAPTPYVVSRSPTRADALRARSSRLVNDGWLRAFRTLSLGRYWLDAAREAQAWRPDVVHANDGNTLAPAWWIASRTGARVVYDAHELWRHRNVRQDRPLAPLVESVVESLVIRRAAGVVTVSPSIADWLQETYRLPERPTLVRNVPRRPLEVAHPAGRLRQLAGLAAETQVIAYGGRLTTSRGIEETLQALALLPADVHFVLLGYGEPDYLATLRTLVEVLGVADRVHVVGAVPSHQVAGTLADADLSVVFVRPVCLSYEFSLPNKLFEAIHAGLPIVAADLPDTAAVVREHGVGEIFDVDSPADMARTITDVLIEPQRYRDASRAAADVLTWEHEADQLLGLYARVLDR